MRHGLTPSWQSHILCWHIIEILAHRRSGSQRVRHGDTARVLMTQIKRMLQGLSWPLIEGHVQLRSSILSRMGFLDTYQANFNKLWVIMDVIFQPRHATRVTNKPLKHIYLQYIVRLVEFSLLHSHHVFFDFELVDTVNTDLTRLFTLRCRWLIPLRACWNMNLFLISPLKATDNVPSTVSSIATIHRRKVATAELNYTKP
jgi:hypothetical protein